jgi:hypothetical protein
VLISKRINDAYKILLEATDDVDNIAVVKEKLSKYKFGGPGT